MVWITKIGLKLHSVPYTASIIQSTVKPYLGFLKFFYSNFAIKTASKFSQSFIFLRSLKEWMLTPKNALCQRCWWEEDGCVMWETEFMRTFSLVTKRNLLLVVLIKLIVTRQQVPGRIYMENAGCQKCNVVMEIIYYQLKGTLRESSNWQSNIKHISGFGVKSSKNIAESVAKWLCLFA